MIKAFDAVKTEKGVSHQLIIAGEQGWKFDRQQAVQGCNHPQTIRFIGFVPDEDMAALYSAASLFVFPTLYEGFGIPVLEAQVCGVPVLTSNCTSLPEVGGEGAYYVDPYSEKEIGRHLETSHRAGTSRKIGAAGKTKCQALLVGEIGKMPGRNH